MKVHFNFCRLNGWKPGAGIFCLIVALVAGGGCGKPKNTTTPVPPTPASDTATTPAANPAPANRMPSTPPPVSINVNAIPNPNGPTQLQLLNRALMGWKMNNHRQPKTFEEFSSTAGFQIPNPPAGKKYTLSPKGFIVLVNSN
jgi:hypothetical protein